MRTSIGYSANCWVERNNLFRSLDEFGVGSIAFSPLALGMLTNKYLDAVPHGSRADKGQSLDATYLTDDIFARLTALNEIASSRGQTLAKMPLAWALRDGKVTSALIGASKVSQIEDCIAVASNMELSSAELVEIDKQALDSEILNLWAQSTESE